MRQADYNRAEEYIELRAELRELLAHGRYTLYITSVFIIGALAWYLGRLESPQIDPAIFGAFLYVVVIFSSVIYVSSINGASRIGGYIATFWESRDPDLRLQWHRFNRRGATGGFLAGAAQFAYTLLTLIVAGFLMYSFHVFSVEIRGGVMSAILWGVGQAIAFTQLRKYLQNQTMRFEREWRAIKESPEQQAEIHAFYESYLKRY